METDDATGLPINYCKNCKNQVIGFVDDPEKDFYCEKCESELEEDEDE